MSEPLKGLTVLDLATLYAGPFAAMLLGDFGADVIKVEHPRGDPLRGHGYSKNGHGLWWKVIARNKRCVSLDLSKPEGQRLLLQLASTADVLVESFRPGVMERWNLGYDQLSKSNPGLIMLRVSGFGQTGPYAGRPGFGTIAESLSSWAHNNGHPDGPPTLPPFGLADGITGLTGAFAVMVALHNRAKTDRGQVIDLSLIEPILMVLGPHMTVYDQLGVVPTRTGNRSSSNAPRNVYKTRDGRWVALSTSAQPVAERVMKLVGHAEVIDEPWFKTAGQRAAHADLLDALVGGWISNHDFSEVMHEFEQAAAAVAPVNDIRDVMSDLQYQALSVAVTVEDPDLGPLRMQNVIVRLLGSPGSVRFSGRDIGQDNEEVFFERLRLPLSQLQQLKAAGVL